MSGRADTSPDSSSPLGGSPDTRKSANTADVAQRAGINFLMRVVADAADHDVCVFGPMRAAPVELSLPRVSKVVRRYYRFGVQTGVSLIDFLGEHLHLSMQMRDHIVRHHGWERALMYLDPTGDAAVRNVSKERNV